MTGAILRSFRYNPLFNCSFAHYIHLSRKLALPYHVRSAEPISIRPVLDRKQCLDALSCERQLSERHATGVFVREDRFMPIKFQR